MAVPNFVAIVDVSLEFDDILQPMEEEDILNAQFEEDPEEGESKC